MLHKKIEFKSVANGPESNGKDSELRRRKKIPLDYQQSFAQ